jgi:nucleotide-binding universal stress UspA family protein
MGSQKRAGQHEVPVGSVVGQVTARAHCPVIVVTGDDQPASVEAAASAPVVAGVDDSPAAADVVAFALAEAAARGHELVLVVCGDGEPAGAQRPEDVSAPSAGGGRVTGSLREQAATYPDVTVSQVTGQGDLAEFLLGVAADANAGLIVVGSRGHSEILGLLRRSVDRRLVRVADRAVAVVHRRRSGDD